ncbi:hypothetical protein Tco_1390701, partial [Tanacetum coccineum]
MSALKFADSHNMVAFLAKPTKSEGFEQIVDFLNANPIKYALTLQALVDGKKVIITETSVRRDLQLEDAEGIECLPNADIFEQLALMGAKSTAWNEFSSTMASAIICLATNQKFNFSKYIFESMVKNVDSSVKFLMYPRFVQVFLDKQIGDMSTHDEIFVTPSHTKKVFGNMKRVGKGFSGAVTPLFPTMMVQAQEEMGEGSAMPTDPHHTPIIQPSTSQPQKKQSRRKQRKGTEIPQSSVPTEPVADEAVHEERGDSVERAATTASSLEVEQDSGNIIRTQSTAIPNSNDPPLSRVNTLRCGEDRLKLKELTDLYTKLSDRVLDLETTKTAQAKEIASLKKRVKKLERKRKSKTPGMKRLFKIGRSARVISSDEDKVTLVDETQGRYEDAQMFDTDVFNGEEVFVAEQSEKVVEEVVSTAEVSAAATITTEEITLAQTLVALKSAKPNVDKVVSQKLEQGITKPTAPPTTATTTTTTKGILLHEPSETRTTTRTTTKTTTPVTSSKDKG